MCVAMEGHSNPCFKQASVSCLLHHGRGLSNAIGQVHNRYFRRQYAEGHASKLPDQFGAHLANCLRDAHGGRNDVLGRTSASTPVPAAATGPVHTLIICTLRATSRTCDVHANGHGTTLSRDYGESCFVLIVARTTSARLNCVLPLCVHPTRTCQSFPSRYSSWVSLSHWRCHRLCSARSRMLWTSLHRCIIHAIGANATVAGRRRCVSLAAVLDNASCQRADLQTCRAYRSRQRCTCPTHVPSSRHTH